VRRLHGSYAASWDIDMASVEALPAGSAYTKFLLATAATSELGVIYAAMTPCMRLYAWLGQSLNADTAGPYEQWVRTYADSEFDAVARILERLLDEQADTSVVRSAYRRAMQLELAFFDACWNAESTAVE
jgi:thiaminase (transcriptional activator TenA)